MRDSEVSFSVKAGTQATSESCPDTSPYSNLTFVLMVSAVTVAVCVVGCILRKRSASKRAGGNFFKSPISKAQQKAKDAGTVAYIGRGRDRMSVELCQTCIESNKMLAQLAQVTGCKNETFEPCELCRLDLSVPSTSIIVS
jgi:hypothetical protein